MKKETVNDFLKRGGTITMCPARGTPRNPVNVRAKANGRRPAKGKSTQVERQMVNANYRGRV